jgi:signal transduction histidine kinase
MSITAGSPTIGLRRVAVEVGLLTFALTLPIAAILRPALGLELNRLDPPELEKRWLMVAVAMIYVGLIAAGLATFRRRGADGGRPAGGRRELASALGFVAAVVAGMLLANAVGTIWLMLSRPDQPLDLVALASRAPFPIASSAVVAVVTYGLGRGFAIVAPRVHQLRRTSLLWALTHAQLVAALRLAFVLAAVITAVDLVQGRHRFGPPFGTEILADDASLLKVAVIWVATRLLPAITAWLIIEVLMVAAVLPPAALISYMVLRRATARLNGLAATAEELRAGNLAARVTVDGEDEIAALQSTFNSMADDLERTLGDLAAERDRVTGLLEAHRQLVASASHELRTPVATVRGYLESLLRQASSTDELRTDLETVQREVTRLQRLIDDLFTLSRAEVGRLELRLAPTDIGAVLCRVVTTAAPLAWTRRQVQVVADVAPELPMARADAERLEQIIGNLLGNAIRHTPPGGLVAVTASADACGASRSVRIEVRDTGDGIAAADLPRIFGRFYRGSNGLSEGEDRHVGAGLGLTLARELAVAMEGSIEATSVPGEGSCFAVRLPQA